MRTIQQLVTLMSLAAFLCFPGCSVESPDQAENLGQTESSLQTKGSRQSESSLQTETLEQLRALALANLIFESDHMRFPNTRIDPEIKRFSTRSRLSWRVQVLKYLGGQEEKLYQEFRHDEPWDSDHNSKLIDKMPKIFKCNHHDVPSGKTLFACASIATEVWEKDKSFSPFAVPNLDTTFSDVSDGTSFTIMLVEVNPEKAITWTKPEDWEFTQTDPYQSIDQCWSDSVLVVFADGTVGTISPSKMSPDKFRTLISKSSGDNAFEKTW